MRLCFYIKLKQNQWSGTVDIYTIRALQCEKLIQPPVENHAFSQVVFYFTYHFVLDLDLQLASKCFRNFT